MSKSDKKGPYSMPKNINEFYPEYKSDALRIEKLIKKRGKVVGYHLSDGRNIDKDIAVSLAKEGMIMDVAVATRNDSEYLRSLPDVEESNNLSNLSSISADELSKDIEFTK